jgi:Flp pilus assembly protein TadG
MRVTLPPGRRLLGDESGAVLAIVAISMIVLLGMLVLTVDLGRSVAIKRQMVNGTDAAALAAAQACALGRPLDTARAAAVDLLQANKASSDVSAFSAPQCGGGLSTFGAKQVEVLSRTTVGYFFAPLFGFDSGTVVATSTAIWGPIATARPIPITVDQSQLQGCHIPSEIADGGSVACELSYPKDALSEPRWGALDLAQWNDPGAAPCHVPASTLVDQIEGGGWPTPLPINQEPLLPGEDFGFTPDCLDNGLEFSVWMSMEGKVLTFPVIDIPTSTGDGCTGTDAGCQIDTANIVAFVTLHVISAVNDGSTVRLQVEWLGPTTVPDGDIGGGPDYGSRAIRLVK